MLFRTDDLTRWGSGAGRNLIPSEIDDNFWELRSALNDLIANPPSPVSIVSITGSGNTITFRMSDGTSIGPVYMPILQFRWREEWLAATPFEVLDVFRVTDVGLYSVLQDHISPATFDENFVIAGNPAYYKLFGFSPGSKYFIATNFNGVMANDQDLIHHALAGKISFPANFGDFNQYSSDAGAVTVATADAVITVSIAPKATPNVFTDVGTITIAAGTVTPALATTGGLSQTGNKGDIVRIRGPAIADTTLAGFYCTLVAQETI